MNKLINVLIVAYSCFSVCYSQEIPHKLVYEDTIPYFYAWRDSIICTKLSGKKGFSYLLVNNRVTDTIKSQYGRLGYNISGNDVNYPDIIYAIGEQLHRLSLTTGKLEPLLISEPCQLVFNNQLIGVDTSYFLVSYDILNNQKKKLCEVYKPDYEIVNLEISATGIIHITLSGMDAYGTINYLYDLETGSFSKIDFSKYTTLQKGEVTLVNEINIEHSDITFQYIITGFYWMDNSFNVIQPTLSRRRSSYIVSNRGFKLHHLDSYYYLTSEIDNPVRRNGKHGVWIPCRFTLPFDLCLYKIYNNQILTKGEIVGFDQWELHKLKNMIFAKHNYQFESHYLQAFYNIFQFYNNGKWNRVKEVNHLLTVEDKTNLKIINSALDEKL
ncbi:MAG: YARHG domain-containing protein [Bacteroidales bacterium]|nr:YARHG domain-containing protein [Bacteroidales bacterium]